MDTRWKVLNHPEAVAEYDALNYREAAAVDSVIEKLEVLGPNLPFPHSSGVVGVDKLRELRPRGGRSVTRPLYRQIGSTFVIGAYAPEAKSDHRGFKKSCKRAEARLKDIEEDSR